MRISPPIISRLFAERFAPSAPSAILLAQKCHRREVNQRLLKKLILLIFT